MLERPGETRTMRGPAVAGLVCATLLLLGLGTAGVLAPDPLPVPGLLCLLFAAAPLAAVAFMLLHRRGGGPMTAAWRLLCGAAALAAGATAIGAGSAVIAHSGVYAQRYGAATTMGLPMKCRLEAEPESGLTADITECTHVVWTGPDGQTVRGTLHVSQRFWDDDGGFYDDEVLLDYVEPRPLLKDKAARVRFPVRAAGHDAYLPADHAVATLGRPPLPWLSTAGVLLAAAFGTVCLGHRRPGPSGRSTSGSPGTKGSPGAGGSPGTGTGGPGRSPRRRRSCGCRSTPPGCGFGGAPERPAARAGGAITCASAGSRSPASASRTSGTARPCCTC